MSRTATVRAARNANHVGSTLVSFHTVRVLNHIAAGPLCALEITRHLRRNGHPTDRAGVNRLLARMTRNGWLKTAGRSPDYSLTPKGREALNLFRARLKDLVEVMDLKRQSPRTRKLNNNGL